MWASFIGTRVNFIAVRQSFSRLSATIRSIALYREDQVGVSCLGISTTLKIVIVPAMNHKLAENRQLSTMRLLHRIICASSRERFLIFCVYFADKNHMKSCLYFSKLSSNNQIFYIRITYLLFLFACSGRIIKITKKQPFLEANEDRQNSRARSRDAAYRQIRRIIRASCIILRWRIHVRDISPSLSRRKKKQKQRQKKKMKKRKKKKNQATSRRWLTLGGGCSISWLGFLRRRASLNSHWARSSFRRRKSDAIRVYV